MVFPWGQPTDDGVNEGVSDGANDGAAAALVDRLHALIAAEPGSRVPALSTRLAVSTSSVERALDRLKSAGRVAFLGAPKTGGYYVIGPSLDSTDDGVNEGVNADVSDSAHRLLVLITSEPGLRVPDLSARLALSSATVERAIRRLKSAGRVAFRGAPKTGGYHALTEEEP